MKLFDYTKWQVLETYAINEKTFVVQVRMNNRTGFKHFKVTKYETAYGHLNTSPEKINALFA